MSGTRTAAIACVAEMGPGAHTLATFSIDGLSIGVSPLDITVCLINEGTPGCIPVDGSVIVTSTSELRSTCGHFQGANLASAMLAGEFPWVTTLVDASPGRAAAVLDKGLFIGDRLWFFDTGDNNRALIAEAKSRMPAVPIGVRVDCWNNSEEQITNQIAGLQTIVTNGDLDANDLVVVCPLAMTNYDMSWSQFANVLSQADAIIAPTGAKVGIAETAAALLEYKPQICAEPKVDGYLASMMAGATMSAAEQEVLTLVDIEKLRVAFEDCPNVQFKWVETGRPFKTGDPPFSEAQRREYIERAYAAERSLLEQGVVHGFVYDETTVECWRSGFGEGDRGVFSCDCAGDCNSITDLVVSPSLLDFFDFFSSHDEPCLEEQ